MRQPEVCKPLDCQVYDVWSAALGCRFHAGREANLICLAAEPLWNPPGRGTFAP